MKNFRTSKVWLFLAVLALSALSCQTVMGVVAPTAPPQPPLDEPDLLPTETTIPDPLPASTPDQEQTYTLPLRIQLQIFNELWRIVDEEYLYEDFNGVEWDAAYDEYQALIEAGLSDQEFYLAMDEMIYSLGDDHSIYLSPDQVATEDAEYASGSDYVGIGIWVSAVPERERAVILLTFPGSPAEAAGLQSRDSILLVDGQPVLDEEGYLDDRMLGPEGTQVTITVQSPGGQPYDLTITRARITGSLPVPYEIFTTLLGQRVGYLLIPTFADRSIVRQTQQALEAMTEDGQLDGLIIDNRLNNGGYDDVMADTLRFFNDGLVGYFVNRQGKEPVRVTAHEINGSTEVPLVVLIGYDTVSFGEIFSGILKDQGRAYLIGETTDGNVETLWGYDFDDGSRAWIAHDTFQPANDPNADWEESGIIPDETVLSDWDTVPFEEDPAILAALDYFDR